MFSLNFKISAINILIEQIKEEKFQPCLVEIFVLLNAA